MRRFEVEVRERLKDVVVMTMRGRCVAAVVQVLQDALEEELAKEPRGLLCDISELEELEGQCLYEIVHADRQLRARQGGLALFSMSAVVAQSLRQADLLEELDIYADFGEARQALESHIRNARRAAAAAKILESKPARRRRRRLRKRQGEKISQLAARILGA